MFASISAEAWSIIEGTFAAHSSAHSSQLRAQLGKANKFDSSIDIFFNHVKTLLDTLASIG
jgi:hypothetical protein